MESAAIQERTLSDVNDNRNGFAWERMRHMKRKWWHMMVLGLTSVGLLSLQVSAEAAAVDKVAANPTVSTLSGYDRVKVADANYEKLHGKVDFPLEKTDPEYAAMMKKYIYGDIAKQMTITPVEQSLVVLSVLTTNQNADLLPDAAEEALAAGATPLQIREAIYHITPYVGFAKTEPAVRQMNEVFRRHGVKLPLKAQGTTTDADRFEKGLAYQTGKYGARITEMRERTPAYEKHLQDDLSAFCFGDIYTRGTLDHKEREMLTVAAIGTLGIEAQFRSHVNGTLAAGATKEEVIGIITAMNPYVGFPRTLWMLQIANGCFEAAAQAKAQ